MSSWMRLRSLAISAAIEAEKMYISARAIGLELPTGMTADEIRAEIHWALRAMSDVPALKRRFAAESLSALRKERDR